MPAFNLETCARPNILSLEPYRCARDDYKDDGTNVLLDANENAHPTPLPPAFFSSAASLALNRYPDPHQFDLKARLCALRSVNVHTSRALAPDNVFAGLGSDEAIDALLRCFCAPGRERLLICPPTYGMYAVAAQVNDVEVVRVPLTAAPEFGIDVAAVRARLTADPSIKLVYLCSPGNPTGRLLRKDDVRQVLEAEWNGVVVLDEAYVDFAPDVRTASLAEWVLEWPNLVVMQTLSKAFGLASIRLGVAFAPAPIARLLNSMKAPYNVPGPTAEIARAALAEEGLARVQGTLARLGGQRDRLVAEMAAIPGVGRLRGGLDANFILWEMLDGAGKPSNEVALAVYQKLATERGVVVRFRGREHGCEGCLRVTVGTESEVTRFLVALREVLAEVTGARAGSLAG